MQFETLSGELVVEGVHDLDAKTFSPVPIASHRGGLYLGTTSSWRMHLHHWAPENNRLQELPVMATTVEPVLAADDSDMFHVVHNRLTGECTFESLSPWSPPPRVQVAALGDALRVHNPSSPAVAMWGGRLVAVCISGAWNKVKVFIWQKGTVPSSVDLGRSRHPRVRSVGLSQHRLAATAIGPELVVAWITRPNLIRPELELLWTHRGRFTQPVTLTGVDGIAGLCELAGELVVAWVASRHSYIGFFRNGHLVPALRRRARRHAGPGFSSWYINDIRLCSHNSYLLATGVGPRRQVQVTRLRRA